mgnify:FL=1|jgi:hypothetical protein
MLTFFGLTSEYRSSLFSQIHEIVFNGQGGYDYETVYNMPIWLRNFTFQKLKDHYDALNKKQNKKPPSKSTTPSWVRDAKEAAKSGKKPSYTVKRS